MNMKRHPKEICHSERSEESKMPNDRNVSYDQDFRPFTPFRVTSGEGAEQRTKPAHGEPVELPYRQGKRTINLSSCNPSFRL